MTPQHYNKKIQPLDYIEANGLDFAEGNVIKYVTRYKEKGGLDDLLKAKDYLQTLINRQRKPFNKSILKEIQQTFQDDTVKPVEEYYSLLKSGMFYEFYPELSGEWEKDRDQWLTVIYPELLKTRNNG